MTKLGCLVIDVLGSELVNEDKDILEHPLVGGVILFARHYESRQQLIHLCKSIRASRKKPILIMVDQEGGRVQRFAHEFTTIPTMGTIGKKYDENPIAGLQMAYHYGFIMAKEINSTGIDISLAPILDLNKGLNTVIGERAFHQDPQIVIMLATSFIKGMQAAGMASVGKHFPGHGSVALDSHNVTPVDQRKFSDIVRTDLIPFNGMIQQGITGIMSCHIQFPEVDEFSVTFSQKWLKDILRHQYQFKGIVLSDDLNMEGANISTFYPDRIKRAREAGCDLTLLCNNRAGVIQTLDKLNPDQYQVEENKWMPLQAKGLNVESYVNQDQLWQLSQQYVLTCLDNLRN